MGFKKSYNFVLWFIFCGAMLGFVLARFSYINVRPETLAPGHWYWYRQDFYRVGLTMHLAAILPCGVLCIFQFIPQIRYLYLTVHRINGYIIYALLIVSTFGALMLTRPALGGTLATQLATVWLSFVTITSAGFAYYNIKRLQVDQHRKWMLRTMFYMASIITVRILGIAIMDILFKYVKYKKYFTVWSCDELQFTVVQQYGVPEEYFSMSYPLCAPLGNGTSPQEAAAIAMGRLEYTAVLASSAADAPPEMHGSALRWTYAGTLWWGLLIHMIGVEIYIRLTPGEDNRLRQYSYERQLEAGNTRKPGNAGTTRDRLGDPGDFPHQFRQKTATATEGNTAGSD
ncbi:hypothetical protein BDZ91DRAFT_652196 [Kalaharituber pfeilii]|nr:hypothetical protein BDZ91DRAFT_652196 [Kalaharituber pfeilii]